MHLNNRPRPRSLSLEVIQIKEPCSADWGRMVGDDARRFCSDCELTVHNLSGLPRAEGEKLLGQVQHGRVCVQMRRLANGRVETLEDRRPAARWRRRAGFAGMQVLLSLGTAAVVMLGLTGVCVPGERKLQQRLEALVDALRVTPPPAPPIAGDIAVPWNVPPPAAPADPGPPFIMGEALAVPVAPPVDEQPPAVRGRIAPVQDSPPAESAI